jgi:hypothetical protein
LNPRDLSTTGGALPGEKEKIKMKVQPTMLLKTNEEKMSLSVEPTMSMKIKVLTNS